MDSPKSIDIIKSEIKGIIDYAQNVIDMLGQSVPYTERRRFSTVINDMSSWMIGHPDEPFELYQKKKEELERALGGLKSHPSDELHSRTLDLSTSGLIKQLCIRPDNDPFIIKRSSTPSTLVITDPLSPSPSPSSFFSTASSYDLEREQKLLAKDALHDVHHCDMEEGTTSNLSSLSSLGKYGSGSGVRGGSTNSSGSSIPLSINRQTPMGTVRESTQHFANKSNSSVSTTTTTTTTPATSFSPRSNANNSIFNNNNSSSTTNNYHNINVRRPSTNNNSIFNNNSSFSTINNSSSVSTTTPATTFISTTAASTAAPTAASTTDEQLAFCLQEILNDEEIARTIYNDEVASVDERYIKQMLEIEDEGDELRRERQQRSQSPKLQQRESSLSTSPYNSRSTLSIPVPALEPLHSTSTIHQNDFDDDEFVNNLEIVASFIRQRQIEGRRMVRRRGEREYSYEELLEIGEKIGNVGGLKESELEQLPTFVWKGENLADKTCSICMSAWEKSEVLRRLNCLHCFHKDCIDQWLKTHNTCPICKSDVRSQ